MTTNITSLLNITLGNITSGNSHVLHEHLIASEIFAVVLMSVTTLVAFQANLSILVVVLITPQLRSSLANIFVINLCSVDLLASGIALPISITTFVKGAEGLDKTTCDVSGFFSTCVMVTSVLSLCAISIERYYTISFPMHQAGHATPRLYLLAVASVWGASLTVASLPLLGVNAYRFRSSRRSCSYNWQGGNLPGTVFILLIFFISFLIPSIILLSMYAAIFRVAKKAATVITPNANGISLSPVKSQLFLGQREDALFTVSGHGASRQQNVVAPKVKITEVSQNSVQYDEVVFLRRLSVEDSGIRTADFTDAMSLKSFISSNNNIQQNDILHFNTHSKQELKPSVQTTGADLFPRPRVDVELETQPSSSAHPISGTLGISNSEHLDSLVAPPVVIHPSRIRSSHIKAFRTLMVIVVSYLLQWGPYFTCLLHELTRGREASESLELVVSWLSYSSYAANPVLYGCMNRQIREELTQLLSSLWRCCCCYFPCFRRGHAREPPSSCHCQNQNVRDKGRGPKQLVQEGDIAAGEAESFYQFLQRTQASEEMYPEA